MAFKIDRGSAEGTPNISIPDKTLQASHKETESFSYSKNTEEDLNVIFKEVFDKYKIEYSIENLIKYLGENCTKEELLSIDKNTLKEKAKLLEQTLAKPQNNALTQKNNAFAQIASQTGWKDIEQFTKEVEKIKNISKDELKAYFEKNYKKFVSENVNEQKAKEMLFGVILAKTADEDKISLKSIINEDIKSSEVLDTVFNSFENKDKKTQFADSLTYDEWKNLSSDKMKIQYLQNMSKKGITVQQQGYKEEVTKFYLENGERLAIIEANTENLTQDDLDLLAERDRLLGNGAVMSGAVAANANLTEEEKENHVKEFVQIARDYGFEAQYLKKLADFLSDSNIDFNGSKEDVIKILDSVTDNKFSKLIPEKNAINSETGLLKTPSGDVETQKNLVEELKKTYIQQEKEEKISVEKTEPQTSGNNSEPTKTPSFFEKYTNTFIADIITGKNSNCSNNDKKIAINRYKQFNLSDKILLLNKATGEMASQIIKNSDSNVLSKYLQIFGVGNSFDLTKQMKETIEEKEDKKAS